MKNFLITPILFDYHFLDNLCLQILPTLSLASDKYQQLKTAVFISFNRYLVDSLLLMPENEAKELLDKLTVAMLAADENLTLNLLKNEIDFFDELVEDYLEIINKLK